jgi:hypothetical protein
MSTFDFYGTYLKKVLDKVFFFFIILNSGEEKLKEVCYEEKAFVIYYHDPYHGWAITEFLKFQFYNPCLISIHNMGYHYTRNYLSCRLVGVKRPVSVYSGRNSILLRLD